MLAMVKKIAATPTYQANGGSLPHLQSTNDKQ
jgi:hypothetical protein